MEGVRRQLGSDHGERRQWRRCMRDPELLCALCIKGAGMRLGMHCTQDSRRGNGGPGSCCGQTKIPGSSRSQDPAVVLPKIMVSHGNGVRRQLGSVYGGKRQRWRWLSDRELPSALWTEGVHKACMHCTRLWLCGPSKDPGVARQRCEATTWICLWR